MLTRPTVLAFLLSFLAALPAIGAEPAAGSPNLAAKLQPFVDSHTLAGAVLLVANKDKVLDVETVGFADIEGQKPMRPDSLVWIASQTKPITAAGLMILVDEGKVNLDDPVEKYLGEFRDQWLAVERDGEHVLLRKPKQKVTVRHLLNHTSGMPFKSYMEEPTLDKLSLADAVRSYVLTPLDNEPGTKWNYCNAGINTAGRIIEVVSGQPYEVFMQERLFGPLGMKDTTFWPQGEQLDRIAKSYQPNETKDGLKPTTIGQLHYPIDDRRRQPMPAGGLFWTAADVAQFCRMVLAGGTLDGRRYLSEDAVRQMTSNQTGDLPAGYGLGWQTEKRTGGVFGHGGAMSTNMQIDPEKQLVLVYLVQHAGYPGSEGGNIYPTFAKAAAEAFAK